VPFVPEVSLYQAEDIYAVWEQTERELGRPELPPPFWCVPWPGGQALARYVLDHPGLVAGRKVLDLGAGSGLVAIAVAKAGAGAVTAAETDPLARAAVELNAAANGMRAADCVDDVFGIPTTADVVLAGDVWYDKDLARLVGGYLDSAAAGGALVLTGDIGRAYFPRDRYRQLAGYDVPVSTALEGSKVVKASVWQVSAQSSPDVGSARKLYP
jgi:predicted nicotinamide N-methyase